jgi:hypothetical protein
MADENAIAVVRLGRRIRPAKGLGQVLIGVQYLPCIQEAELAPKPFMDASFSWCVFHTVLGVVANGCSKVEVSGDQERRIIPIWTDFIEKAIDVRLI